MQIPALEPMVIPMLVVNRNEDALKVKATIKDVQAWGGSKFVINNLKYVFKLKYANILEFIIYSIYRIII